MDRAMSNVAFEGMAWMFWIRDRLVPREQVLAEVEVGPGERVLDLGCGPGSYVPLLAERVGPAGRVYALDVHPRAIARVQRLAVRRGLTQVETICADGQTGLPPESLDRALLFDVWHMLEEPQAVLAELHRVLKSQGTLYVLEPHLSREETVTGIEASGLFVLETQGARVHRFAPVRAR